MVSGVDALTVAAASGMKARLESLELLANNLANQTSAGYKADRESYGLYLAPEALDDLGAGVLPSPPHSPVIERHWTDHGQGAVARTEGPLDIALRGNGFLTVQGPNGPLYTRNGALRLSAAGQLETSDGYPVLDAASAPVRLNGTGPVSVDEQGFVRQAGLPPTRLGVVEFSRPGAMAKRSGTYFEISTAAGPAQPFSGKVMQGYLEQSNGSPAESAVRLVTLLRQFEMLQKAIQIDSEMGRRAEDIARTGQ